MKFDLVIAHYKENLNWVKAIKKGLFDRIFIYSKSSPSENLSNDLVRHSCLPNVGRESHTYLTHCINSWHEMESGLGSDFTFFLQGSPHGMNERTLSEWIEVVANNRLDFTLNYKFSSPLDFLSGGRCKSWAGSTHPAEFDVKGWCEKYVKTDPLMSRLPIFWNACFGVSTRCILTSPWSRLVNLAQDHLSNLNPECGHYCERLWYYIMCMDSVPMPELPERVWYFWGGPQGSNHYGALRLNENGSIGLYDNRNESFWKSEGDSIVLMDNKKVETCVLRRISDEEYSGVFLRGSNSVHRLTRRFVVPK